MDHLALGSLLGRPFLDAGNLNFRSTSYDWLVISGARAQFKGTGTINGIGSYQFLLTAIDGQISAGGGNDAFRIKITDPNRADAATLLAIAETFLSRKILLPSVATRHYISTYEQDRIHYLDGRTPASARGRPT